MSRIGKTPIPVPDKVKVSITGQAVEVEGPKGKLNWDLPKQIAATQKDNEIVVERSSDVKEVKALHGLARSLVNNMVIGVANGFAKTLLLQGVGYRAAAKGSVLNLTLGFSHPVDYQLPEGITAECPNQTTVVVSGVDKQRVGQAAAEIRAFRPPEPYKGKGVRYADEHVRRKEAKKK